MTISDVRSVPPEADELFAELSLKPLGAASLAQCHRGVLHDGRVVAVKIQHPDVRRNAYTDMNVIDVSQARHLTHLQYGILHHPTVAGSMCLASVSRISFPMARPRSENQPP